MDAVHIFEKISMRCHWSSRCSLTLERKASDIRGGISGIRQKAVEAVSSGNSGIWNEQYYIDDRNESVFYKGADAISCCLEHSGKENTFFNR